MSVYKTLSGEQIENVLSDYLINSWSYSKVTGFARHEKLFEMENIYGYRSKSSSSSVAGQAYHHALEHYFKESQENKKLDIADLEILAYEYIEEVSAASWKLQKTSPTVEDCKAKAVSIVTQGLRNFFSEVGTYEDEIEEILEVEVYCDEWLTINGVDIPMPCHAKIDLVFRSKSQKKIIADHKLRAVFSNEEEMLFSIATQAVTYTKCYESKTGIKIDEIWFVENKYSKNRDNSAQLNAFKVILDDDTVKLYEALLYEPLRRMISAAADPDYVYLINESDNFVDKAEIYDFWAKTMISEVEDFNVEETKKEMVAKRLKKIRDASVESINPKVIKQFRQNASQFIQYDLSNKNMTQEEKIEHVLNSFGARVRVAYTFDGYSSNTYLLEVSAGVKITSIQSHKLDIANALNVSTVRISKDLVVHEDKSYISVEFSKKRERDLMFEPEDLIDMKIPLGRNNQEQVIIWNLDNQSTPHMLVSGSTGSGKSVSIRSTIEYARNAGITEIIILDPKYEFTEYNKDETITVYNEIIDIEDKMAALVEEMNLRVELGVNKKTLVVFDEFADAVANSRSGKELEIWENIEVGHYRLSAAAIMMGAEPQPKYKRTKTGEYKSLEENLRILLQKGRSSGYRIIAATQRASVKVISGDSKTNLPVQLCFRVPKEIDSKVVLDESGAEGLAGRGDFLLKSPEYTSLVRGQAYFKS